MKVNTEMLEERTISSKYGETKVKALYEGFSSYKEAKEIYTSTLASEGVLVENKNKNGSVLPFQVSVSDDKYVVIGIIEPEEDYADITYTLYYAEVDIGKKVYLPQSLFEVVDSLSGVYKLPLNAYTGVISPDINGGWLVVPTIRKKVSFLERKKRYQEQLAGGK